MICNLSSFIIAASLVIHSCSCSNKKSKQDDDAGQNPNAIPSSEQTTTSTDSEVNTPPTVSSLPSTLQLSDGSVHILNFAIDDAEQDSASLTLALTERPSIGILRRNDIPLDVGDAFSFKDVEDQLIYLDLRDYDSDTATNDINIKLSVSDGVNTQAIYYTYDFAPICPTVSSPTLADQIGQGTELAPFVICNETQLTDLSGKSSLWSKHFVQKDDVDISAVATWSPIGTPTAHFTGSYNGFGHTITGLKANGAIVYNGLFGRVSGAKARLANIVLEAVNNDAAQDFVGGLVSTMYGGEIQNIAISGTRVGGNSMVGGICGLCAGTIISAAQVNIEIDPDFNYAGGVVGSLRGHVIDSYSTANFDASLGSTRVGGIVGSFMGQIKNAYNTGNITGNNVTIGGIFGYRYRWNTRVENVFSTGTIQSTVANDSVGKIGGNATFELEHHYINAYTDANDGICINLGAGNCNTADLEDVQGTPGDRPQKTVDLGTTPDYFEHKENAPLDSWDFTNVWKENVGSLPTIELKRQTDDYFTCADHSSDAPFAGGDGSIYNPYLICTVNQFLNIDSQAQYLLKHYKLMANLSFTAGNSDPIGADMQPFQGTFDGNGFTIDGFTFGGGTEYKIGLFADAYSAIIKNLNLTNVAINGLDRCGGLIGSSDNVQIINVSVEGGVTCGSYAGLIAGVGIDGFVLTDVQAIGSVSASGSYSGGLVGMVNEAAIIFRNNYFVGNVTGTSSVGGLIGHFANFVQPWETAEMYNVFVQANVTGNTTNNNEVGAVFGYNNSGNDFINCYFENTLTTVMNSGGGTLTIVPNFTGESKANLVNPALTPLSQWDLNNTWSQSSGEYPVLRFE